MYIRDADQNFSTREWEYVGHILHSKKDAGAEKITPTMILEIDPMNDVVFGVLTIWMWTTLPSVVRSSKCKKQILFRHTCCDKKQAREWAEEFVAANNHILQSDVHAVWEVKESLR